MRWLILSLFVFLSACSSVRLHTCEPVPPWILKMPPPPTADHLVVGESTKRDTYLLIGEMERDRRLARAKLDAAKVHQAPCR